MDHLLYIPFTCIVVEAAECIEVETRNDYKKQV
jgi:hypothetical protein